MQTETTSNEVKTRLSPDGFLVGQSATDKLGFYGATPVAQPSAAAQAAVTDQSGGTAANGVVTITGTYNAGILADAFAAILAEVNAIRSALVSVGIIKGS